MNDLNSSQPIKPIDFGNVYKHFELRETLEKTKNPEVSEITEPISKLTEQIQSNEQIDITQIDNMISTLPFMNDNIRANIKLGIEIYKQLNNFDRNYIHKVINDKSSITEK